MKKIEAIIRPAMLEDVRNALKEAGAPGLMITEIEGHGKQNGITQQWRGKEYKVELLSKIKIEIIAHDNDVKKIVNTITGSARTGEIGDGKIFIIPLDDVIRIRTGESGDSAV